MNGWEAVVFDLDDTLYSEQDYVLSGFRGVAAWVSVNLGFSAHRCFAELTDLFDSGVRGQTFNRWLVKQGCNADDLVPILVKVYREHQPRISPFAGMLPLLDALQNRSRLGIVSDGEVNMQRSKLVALGLAHRFDAVVFSDEWGRHAWKPSTKPFAAILARLCVGGGRAVYVGDNPAKDFFGARGVGMSTIRFRHASGQYRRLDPPSLEYVPDCTVDSVEELRDVLTVL